MFYKKIDKSIFKYGTTLPKEYIGEFIHGQPINAGISRDVILYWKNKNKTYRAKLWHVNNANQPYQLRWDSNTDLLTELKKEFIQSYLAIESRNYQSKIEGKYYITDLLGGNQEVLIFKPVDLNNIEIETFIKISTPYDNIFKRLVDENVFGWLSKTSRDYLITKSTPWYPVTELTKHSDAAFVIYYLIDEGKKEIYIGSAERLGDRVKIGRSEIPGWTIFRYEIIHPDYHHSLRRIEHHAIGAFSRIFYNNGKISCFPVSDYRLVNKNWSKAK
jgi:hypothetical protein